MGYAPLRSSWEDNYMNMARLIAGTSQAERAKVGCIIVLPSGLVSLGINGTPSKWHSNVCEEDGETLPEVLHAEENALSKLLVSGTSSVGGHVFVTRSPCRNCAKLLIAAKVSSVTFFEFHSETIGLSLLQEAKEINVFHAKEVRKDNNGNPIYTYERIG